MKPADKSRQAKSGFMLRLGQAKRIDERYDRDTLPLFPLLLIMQADGTLLADVEKLARKVQA